MSRKRSKDRVVHVDTNSLLGTSNQSDSTFTLTAREFKAPNRYLNVHVHIHATQLPRLAYLIGEHLRHEQKKIDEARDALFSASEGKPPL